MSDTFDIGENVRLPGGALSIHPGAFTSIRIGHMPSIAFGVRTRNDGNWAILVRDERGLLLGVRPDGEMVVNPGGPTTIQEIAQIIWAACAPPELEP